MLLTAVCANRAREIAASSIRSCSWRILHVHGALIHTSFKSLASVCARVAAMPLVDASHSAQTCIRRPEETGYAGSEGFWACGRWRLASVCRSGRACQCAVAQQSRRRRGGSGGCQVGDDGSALATSRLPSRLPSPSSSVASLAPPPSSPSPPSSSSLAPLVIAATWRRCQQARFIAGLFRFQRSP